MTWDDVHDGRRAFLACMSAVCSPGTPIELPPVLGFDERPELDRAASILLALLDRGLSLGVSGSAAARRVAAMVAARTGATLGEIGAADWTLVHGPAADAITRAPRGDHSTPQTGATVVVAATESPAPITITGPGVRGRATTRVALDALAVHAFTAANSAPPRGVDLFVVGRESLIGLPRSVSIQPGAG